MNSTLQKAVAFHQSGNLSEAERLYNTILTADPRQADALALLGVIYGSQGKHDEAIKFIERAIKYAPKSALFKFHYGSVLMNAKLLSEAIIAFRSAILIQPGLVEAHYNLANALRANDDWVGATKSYKDAIRYRPNYSEAYNNLALCHVHEKLYDDALTAAQRAVELAPHYGEGWITVCNVAEKLKKYDVGLFAAENAIRLQPENHYSWFGYGVILNRLDRHEEAIVAYKRALELKPSRADIWDNLGQTYQSLNRLQEAEDTYRKTIEVAGQTILDEEIREVDEEEYGNRHWHLALMELLRGKYKSGFARYRSRFKNIGGLQRPVNFQRPLWKGEDVHAKTILVCDEQGFGDTIMLARYLPLLKERGARVILSVHPVLKPLFENWSGIDEVIVHGTFVASYDFYASVFDLPHRFKTTLETIPSPTPYLPKKEWKDPSLISDDGRLKVGVVWGGNPIHLNDQRRSVPLQIFAELFTNTKIHFYSFNHDKKKGDVEFLLHHPITDLVPYLKNFSISASLIEGMDLMITCDTATAHLAGALGKTVWVLLPYAPDWRWLTERSDSLWYVNMRLFRQANIGDWEGVINEVKQALQELAR